MPWISSLAFASGSAAATSVANAVPLEPSARVRSESRVCRRLDHARAGLVVDQSDPYGQSDAEHNASRQCPSCRAAEYGPLPREPFAPQTEPQLLEERVIRGRDYRIEPLRSHLQRLPDGKRLEERRVFSIDTCLSRKRIQPSLVIFVDRGTHCGSHWQKLQAVRYERTKLLPALGQVFLGGRDAASYLGRNLFDPSTLHLQGKYVGAVGHLLPIRIDSTRDAILE
jgi:hypothetical protein